ncbi:MAG: hypothetical protein KDJ51_15105 [Nitratireductor sp.]|nr:hypothetical protein [Nitratireductor sp.]
MPFTTLPDSLMLLLAKLVGALSGAAISLAYMLPKGRREAALRFFTGFAAGMVFGYPAGLKLAAVLDLGSELSRAETALCGAAATSLAAWWALGFLVRFADQYRFNGK